MRGLLKAKRVRTLSSAVPNSHEGLGHEPGERKREKASALQKMGQGKSKPSGPMGKEPQSKLPPIPPDSPLGLMLETWEDNPRNWGRSKVKVIHYCIEIWGGKEIRKGIWWPIFRSFEDWVCQALNMYVNTKEPPCWEESEYA